MLVAILHTVSNIFQTEKSQMTVLHHLDLVRS